MEFKPISCYGVIGDTGTVALVGRDGSIDWCCFPRLDDPSVFGGLLDRGAGKFRIGITGEEGEQEYITDTNVLKTVFRRGKRKVTLIDFMSISEDPVNARFFPDGHIHRLVECEGGEAKIDVEWSPRFGYSLENVSLRRSGNSHFACGGRHIISMSCPQDVDLRQDKSHPSLYGRFTMRPGDKKAFDTCWDSRGDRSDYGRSHRELERTVDIWRRWVHGAGSLHHGAWAEEWLPMLIRSELLIKLLDQSDTGAIAAAPTTSLPETIGGERNWDYRFSWVRDASLSVQALVSLGHSREAVEFLRWMEDISAEEFRREGALQIMYSIRGQSALRETELPHLSGYKGSKPVRVGNGAAKQFQLETYGELINTGHELIRRGISLKPDVSSFLQLVADFIAANWRRPDHGIWEMRVTPRHFTYSKVMAWHALDTAARIFRDSAPDKAAGWKQEAGRVAEAVLENGFNRELNSFVQSFGSKYPDASNLRIPLLEFLPPDDARIQGTIDLTLRELTRDGLVCRYKNADGLSGEEGAFGVCSFWLADALALSGRVMEAKEVFSQVLSHANHLGLFSEQFDLESGEFRGNFPQGLTHIGLINSALYIAYAEGKSVPHPLPIGTKEHREYMGRQ